jgi:hypothetical protein
MDINKIFNLFDSGSREKIQEEEIQVTDLSDHPIYWLGMFKKLIQNHKVFKKKIVSFLEKAQPELDLDDLDLAGDNLAFERAWFYASKFDPNLEEHKEIINLIIDTYLIKSLEESIFHFQEKEEYEKCAHLKKILDEVKKI